MLSLKDCIAMADIPEARLAELEKREHLPIMLAVALAAQRGDQLDLPRSRAKSAAARRRADTATAHPERRY